MITRNPKGYWFQEERLGERERPIASGEEGKKITLVA